MDLLQVIVLSLIQGLTEFLPVSSSAHLILPSRLLGWEDQGVAFDVACHVGTLAAVVLFYRKRLAAMIRDWFVSLKTRQQSSDSRLAWHIVLVTVPVCLAGLVLHGAIEDIFREHAELTIAIATIVFGLLLWVADRFGRACDPGRRIALNSMPLWIALAVGLSQIMAFVPGTSRSGITITVALFLGLSRRDAADYSFLLSIPIIAAAGSYELMKIIAGKAAGAASFGDAAVGIVLSFVSAYVVIRLFIRFISNMGMTPFVIYRILLGCALLAIVFSQA